jgi:hypothetical protein
MQSDSSSLPEPVARELAHNRTVSFRGFRRVDGLWDIEARLRDSKPYKIEVKDERTWEANEAIHDLQIRLTVDDQFIVQDVSTSMNNVPHSDCPKAIAPMHNLIGSKLSRGWRRSVNEHIGGDQGCAHLRELLYNMATVAFQTMYSVATKPGSESPPLHLGQCVTWALDSQLVSSRYPKFFMQKVVK